MSESITPNAFTIFPKTLNCPEYRRLTNAANFLNKETGVRILVKDTYFDFGQDWKYTTLIVKPYNPKEFSWQLLNPKEHGIICYGNEEEYMAVLHKLTDKLKEKQEKKGRYPQLLKKDIVNEKFEEALKKAGSGFVHDAIYTLWQEILKHDTIYPTKEELKNTLVNK